MSDQNTPGENPYGGPPPQQNPYGEAPAGDPYAQPAQPPTYGEQPAYGQPAYGQPAYGQPAHPGAPGADPHRRPTTVTAAAIITMVFSGLSFLLYGVLLIALLVAKDAVLDEIEAQGGLEDAGITASDAYGIVFGVIAVFAVWCLIATILGALVLRRSNAARITLVVSSAVTILVSLLAIGSGLSALTLIAAIAVIVLLFTGGAGDWFKSKNATV